MSFFINKLIIQNNEKVIKKELLFFQKDLNLYIRQYFEIENKEINDKNFENDAENLVKKLASKIENRAIVYSNNGKLLADSANANGEILNYEDISNNDRKYGNEDLKLAINNKSAFNIVPIKDKYIVVFSCPIVSNGRSIGIIRCIRDYSEVFFSSKELLRLINTFILLVFGGVFIFVILLSTKITLPIIRISKASNEVAKGNFDINLNISSRDEIGELYSNFNKMKNQLRTQIETIKSDRDNLKTLENHRKIFFDNVTHEMKTPLTIISGYSQLIIKQNFKDIDFAKKSIKKINDESERMHNMVTDLLEISKCESEINSKVKEWINISDIVNTACLDMKIRADKYEINIEKEIEENIFVLGNSNELRRVIINLIDNSIKYGNAKSNINVKIFDNNNICNIIIEDKGKGIPSHMLQKIFEPFCRVDKQFSREKGSSGLGLAIVKQIISKHKGEINIESEEAIGTKVYIKLPKNLDNS